LTSSTGFNPDAVVREPHPSVRLYTPLYGRFELRARATDNADAMVAFWMIGYEDEPEHSAEICVCEIFGRDIGAEETVVGVGVHPFGDPRITDDFSRVAVPIDAREPHLYSAEWTPVDVTFAIDGRVVKTVDQSPAYPMQLMLSLYDFPAAAPADGAREFVVDHVRGSSLDA
jgi:beta-glucanase (GH16 family)